MANGERRWQRYETVAQAQGRRIIRTERPTADYGEFVLLYGRQQRMNSFISAAGLTLLMMAFAARDAAELVGLALVVVGVGLTLAGLVGLYVTATAHRLYADRLGVYRMVAEQDEEPATGGRAMIQTGGRTFSVAPWHWLTPDGERRLADHLAANAWTMRRDGIRALRVIPGPYVDRWSQSADADGQREGVLAYYTRIGYVDAAGRCTERGESHFRDISRRAAAARD